MKNSSRIKCLIFILFTLLVYSTHIWSMPGYAELSSDGTLWFWSGQKPSEENCYDVEDTKGNPGWDCSKIKRVVFNSSFRSVFPKSTKRWFYNAVNLKEISGWVNLETMQVKDMESMFEGCSSLESVDLSFFSSYETTNMASMFSGCSKIKGAVQFFRGCPPVTTIRI